MITDYMILLEFLLLISNVHDLYECGLISLQIIINNQINNQILILINK